MEGVFLGGYAPNSPLIALPNLMPLISKAKATEAQQQLVFLHSLQKSYFYTNSLYSESLEEIGFIQEPLVTDGGKANYLISIEEVTENGFRAVATAVVDFCVPVFYALKMGVFVPRSARGT